MSAEYTQQWLSLHSSNLPALQTFHKLATTRGRRGTQSANLVLAIGNDPGLSLALLQKVNRQRGPDSKRDPVESYAAGLALLGEPATLNLVKRHPVAESLLSEADQLAEYLQIINRSLHNEVQVTRWARAAGYQQLESFRLAARLAYVGEALCCAYDFPRYQDLLSNQMNGGTPPPGSDEFSFNQLSEAVFRQYHLPDLVIQGLPSSHGDDPRASLVRLLGTISSQCELTWFDETTLHLEQQLAELLQRPLDSVIQALHQQAVEAARESPLAKTWHPAMGLVLVHSPAVPESEEAPVEASPAKSKPPNRPEEHPVTRDQQPSVTSNSGATTNPQKATKAESGKKTSPEQLIGSMARDPQTAQTDIIRACLDALISEVRLDRVCLLLLSRDRNTLQNRMNRGVDDDAPLYHYQVEVSQGGLFKILLNKPQALWVTPENFQNYQKLMPDGFEAVTLNEDFFSMSLFIMDKPIGIMFADARHSSEPLSKDRFTRFKQLVMLCSKALTLHTRLQGTSED